MKTAVVTDLKGISLAYARLSQNLDITFRANILMTFNRCHVCQGVNGHLPGCVRSRARSKPVIQELPAVGNLQDLRPARFVPIRSAVPSIAGCRRALNRQVRAEKAVAKRNMMIGGLSCLGGILVTALTFGAATRAGGGPYVLAWGAVIFGGVQFVIGFAQSR